jgi:hypothetical protein
MGLALAKRQTKRQPVYRSERAAGGTPETQAKLDADPLQHLLLNAWADKSLFSSDRETWNRAAAERAAGEIQAVYRAIVRGMMLTAMKFSDSRAGKIDMPESLAVAHADRYLPWVRAVGPALVNTVIRVVVDRRWIARINYGPAGQALLDYAARMR